MKPSETGLEIYEVRYRAATHGMRGSGRGTTAPQELRRGSGARTVYYVWGMNSETNMEEVRAMYGAATHGVRGSDRGSVAPQELRRERGARSNIIYDNGMTDLQQDS